MFEHYQRPYFCSRISLLVQCSFHHLLLQEWSLSGGTCNSKYEISMSNSYPFGNLKFLQGSRYLIPWDLVSAWESVFTGGVPIGANGCETMAALNPADTSMFAKRRPSEEMRSCRRLFDASPLGDAGTLLNLAGMIVFCEVERGFRGIWHKQRIKVNMIFMQCKEHNRLKMRMNLNL
jgi:hypothetical protein